MKDQAYNRVVGLDNYPVANEYPKEARNGPRIKTERSTQLISPKLDELYGQLREAKEQSLNNQGRLQQLTGILLNYDLVPEPCDPGFEGASTIEDFANIIMDIRRSLSYAERYIYALRESLLSQEILNN